MQDDQFRDRVILVYINERFHDCSKFFHHAITRGDRCEDDDQEWSLAATHFRVMHHVEKHDGEFLDRDQRDEKINLRELGAGEYRLCIDVTPGDKYFRAIINVFIFLGKYRIDDQRPAFLVPIGQNNWQFLD